MKDNLVRFGVAMEAHLLEALDALVEERGGTRSELLRDLARAEVTRSRVADGVPSVAALTIVYDHHVRDLTERLTEFQHGLGEKVRATMHVHLDHDNCLETVMLRGPTRDVQAFANALVAEPQVRHGRLNLVPVEYMRNDGHHHRHVHTRPKN